DQTESEMEPNWEQVQFPCLSLQDQTESEMEPNWEQVQFPCLSLQDQTELEQEEDLASFMMMKCVSSHIGWSASASVSHSSMLFSTGNQPAVSYNK
ncbi:hypothetical protein NQZ68_018367, partial [Dissostichus eleginoides]